MPPVPCSESTPLLLPPNEQEAAPPTPHNDEVTHVRRLAVGLIYVAIFLVFEISSMLVAVPMSPIQEAIICRKHYPDAVNKSQLCKSEVVQSELSMLKGWEITFSLLPGMMTAVLYGTAADKYGCKVVLGLSLLGLTMSQAVDIVVCRFPEIFHIHLIWLGAGLTIVGGGPFVTVAMIFTIATHISTEAQRSTVFFYLSAVSLAGQLIAAPLTYVAMKGDNWFAIFLGFGGLAIATLATAFAPESDSMSSLEMGSDNTHPGSSQIGLYVRLVCTLQQAAVEVRSLFWDSKKLGLLLLTYLFTSLSKNVPVILLQYVTQRFQWTWAEANLLSSISAFVNILAVLLLPIISQLLLSNFELSPLSKDLWFARIAIVALAAGTLGIGLASKPGVLIMFLVIYSCGYGYGPSMRGLVVKVAEDRRIGVLFTSISVLESIGMLISGPLLASTFRVGLARGGSWVGLPFITAGCSLACAGAVVFGLRFHGSTKSARV